MAGAHVRARSSSSSARGYRPPGRATPVEPRHRLGVVVEHVGPGLEHRPQRPFVALEIGNQHFDAAVRAPRLDRANRRGERARAEVRQIVAIDRRDDDVGEFQRLDGVRQVSGSAGSSAIGAPWVTLQ